MSIDRVRAVVTGLILVAACVVPTGCDYTVPLVNEPRLDIDRKGIGLWQQTGAGSDDRRLLVLPLDEKRYLVTYPAGTENAMFARAVLLRHAGMTLVQIDWFGTAHASLPDDERTFQYARYSTEDDVLCFALLNPEVVDAGVSGTGALRAAIEANRDHPELFRDETCFRRLAADG